MSLMKSIHIRAVGSPTEDWQSEAISMYLERLKPFTKVELTEVAEGHQGSAKPDTNKTRAREAESLAKGQPKGSFVIALDETGTNLDSPSFARKLETWSESGRPLVFLIGGSWGLDPALRSQAEAVISLGKQTLPHQLARIVLLEQLYRAETIIRKKEYHK
jgi:23S rRNA (pseudouridine1915-N3)-methyltransferase